MTQRMNALENANRIRYQRAALKAEIKELGRKEGSALLADAIEAMPDWIARAGALEVIGWAPRIGSGTADEIYARLCQSQRRLCELSPRQRTVLADALRAHATGRSYAKKVAA